MGAIVRLTTLLTFVLGLAACTVDDIDKKKCEPGSTDPDLQCVSGYTCVCAPEGCFCEPVSSLRSASHGLVPPPSDPNLELLQRLGAVEEQ
jgi:hypothetical protein